MGCLFCDQAPESVDAREKLAKIAELLGTAINPVRAVERLIASLRYEKMNNEQLRRDRDQWQHECHELKKYVSYREGDERKLPGHYISPLGPYHKRWGGYDAYDATPMHLRNQKPPEEKS